MMHLGIIAVVAVSCGAVALGSLAAIFWTIDEILKER